MWRQLSARSALCDDDFVAEHKSGVGQKQWRIAALFGLIAPASPLLLPADASAETVTRTTAYSYDSASGLLSQIVVEPSTSALRLQTDLTRDASGNITGGQVSGVDITTRSASMSYDSAGRFATGQTNALGQSESATYDARFGAPLTQVDLNGLTTSLAYDAFGRVTLITRQDGTKVGYTYLYCSGVNGGTATCPTYGAYVVTATPYAANGITQNGPITISYYDKLNRPIASDTQGFDGSAIRSALQYDANGNVQKTSRPYFLSGGTPKWTTMTYDALGRVTLSVGPDGADTAIAFHGLSVTVTNDLGQTKTTVKNSRGETASTTDAAGKTTSYTYRPFSNLKTLTDSAGNVATYTYDTRGRRTAASDPDLGAWSYSYNTLSQMVSQTDAKSQTTTLTYDLLGRTTQRVESGLTSTWVYDTATHGIGQLTSASASNGYSRAYAYDTLSRPSQTDIVIDSTTYSIAKAYDANGRLSSLAYPSGFGLTYVYTARGDLSQIKDSATAATFWTANSADAELRLTQETAGNSVVTGTAYNADTGQVQTIQAGPSNAVANFSYSFDTIGNLTNRADAVQSISQSFSYDSLNRLTQAVIAGGATQSVAYNDIGNITSKSDIGTYAYPAAGSARAHAVSSTTGALSTSFSYDANGNMLTGSGRTLTWTAFDMVASIAQGSDSLALTYGPDHARIKQVQGPETTRYLTDPASGARVEKITNASGAVQWNEYLFAGARLIGQHYTSIASGVTTTKVNYFVSDSLGSVAVITDGAGAVVQRLDYDPWGKRTLGSSAQTTRGYTGHEMLDSFGLINMNGRMQDPALARFLSADPIIQDVEDGQTLNAYSYVRNNPMNSVDPSGFNHVDPLVPSVISPIATIPSISLPGITNPGPLLGSPTISYGSSPGAGGWGSGNFYTGGIGWGSPDDYVRDYCMFTAGAYENACGGSGPPDNWPAPEPDNNQPPPSNDPGPPVTDPTAPDITLPPPAPVIVIEPARPSHSFAGGIQSVGYAEDWGRSGALAGAGAGAIGLPTVCAAVTSGICALGAVPLSALGAAGGAVIGGTGGWLGGTLADAKLGEKLFGDWNTSLSQELKTPNRGSPGTWATNPGSGQQRLYGPSGLPQLDIDHDHDHGQGIPHAHDWTAIPERDFPVRGPGRPITPDDPKPPETP